MSNSPIRPLSRSLLLLSLLVFLAADLASAQCGDPAINGDFRSGTDGFWGTMSTWEERIAGSWQAATTIPTSPFGGTTTVCSGDSVTVSVDRVLSGRLAIEANGAITGSPIRTFTATGPIITNDGLVGGVIFKFQPGGGGTSWNGTGTWLPLRIQVAGTTNLGNNVTIGCHLWVDALKSLNLGSDTLTVDGTSFTRTIQNLGGDINGPGQLATMGNVELTGASTWDSPILVLSGTTKTLTDETFFEKDLTVDSGATLEVRGNYTLTIRGNVTNNGKITGGSTGSFFDFEGTTATNNDSVVVLQWRFNGSDQNWAGTGTWINEKVLLSNNTSTTLQNNVTIDTDLDIATNAELVLGGDTLTIDGTGGTRTLNSAGSISNAGEIQTVGDVNVSGASGTWKANLHVISDTTSTVQGGIAFAGLSVDSGAVFRILGNVTNSFSGDVTNNGKITGQAAAATFDFAGPTFANNDSVTVLTLKFSGPGTQTLAGNDAGVIELLSTSLSDTVHVTDDQWVYGSITMDQGILNLQNQAFIRFGGTGSLQSETAVNRVMGVGSLVASSSLTAPSAENPGNLGAVITSAFNPGFTTIIRGHLQLTANGQAIRRYYSINAANNTDLVATLEFNYFDEELNGLTESDLTLFRTEDFSTWTNEGGLLNTTANTATLSGINEFSTWTLGGATGFLAVTLDTARVLLQGPYNSSVGFMSTDLNTSGALPLDQPYDTSAYNGTVLDYDGSESASSFSSRVVDWVLLELRTGKSHTTAVDTTVGLVHMNGTIVGPTGLPGVEFPDAPADSLYLVVRHRNHLSVMSAGKIDFTSGSGTWDFTTGLGQAYTTGPDPMVDVGSGVTGMFGGDYSADQQVTASDFNAWLVDTKAVATGYLMTDGGLDGQATASDFNLWLTNTKAVASSQVPDP